MHQNTLQLFQGGGVASAPLPMTAGAHGDTYKWKRNFDGKTSKVPVW